MVDQRSIADILYWDAFVRLYVNPGNLKAFKGSLVGLFRKQVQVKCYITLRATFGVGEQAKEIKIMYMVIDFPSSYNMIIWKPTLIS